MGEKQVDISSEERKRDFMKHLLLDLKALERMLKEGIIDSGVKRIGAEQELCFIDSSYRPAPVILDFLDNFAKELK